MLNIGSYMGGVNLWQNDIEHDDDFSLQSMHDKMLEVVCICGAWHLGKLQVCEICIFSIFMFECILSWKLCQKMKHEKKVLHMHSRGIICFSHLFSFSP